MPLGTRHAAAQINPIPKRAVKRIAVDRETFRHSPDVGGTDSQSDKKATPIRARPGREAAILLVMPVMPCAP